MLEDERVRKVGLPEPVQVPPVDGHAALQAGAHELGGHLEELLCAEVPPQVVHPLALLAVKLGVAHALTNGQISKSLNKIMLDEGLHHFALLFPATFKPEFSGYQLSI